MSTLDTLSMHNENLSRLLSDKRICSNSKLVAMVISNLQSLDANKGTYSSSSSGHSICKLVKDKLQNVTNLEQEFNALKERYESQRQNQLEYFKRSQSKYLVDSNKARKKIVHSFSALYDVLKNKEHALLTEVAKYNIELDAISMNLMNSPHSNDDDEKGMDFNDRTFILNDCRRYLTEQLTLCQSHHLHRDQLLQITSNIKRMCSEQECRFKANRQWMERRLQRIEENQFNIKSVAFTLNESLFSNIIKEIDNIGELKKYKKLELEIERVEWLDTHRINVHYKFLNHSDLNSIQIRQYEIQYRMVDVEGLHSSDSSIDDVLQWKTVLLPLRSNNSSKMVVNPLTIQIDKKFDNMPGRRVVTSDNNTFIFIKMRVQHSPYYLWSSYSSTLKRKVANYLIVGKGQVLRLRLNQKKKRMSHGPQRGTLKKALTAPSSPRSKPSEHKMKSQSVSPRKPTPSTSDEANHISVISVNSANSSNSLSVRSKGVNTAKQEMASKYHEYYTFDVVIIKEGGTLTIDEHEGYSERGAVNGIYSKISVPNGTGTDNDDDDDEEEALHKPQGYLHLVIEKDLVIERGGKVTVSGMGYSGGGRYESGDSVNSCGEMGETSNNGGGGGGSKTYELGCGGGGGYGTNGDNGCSGKGFGFGNTKTKYREDIDGRGGRVYGDSKLSVCHFGSGGGGGDYGDSTGGNGGGILIVDCKRNVTMHDGSVMAANGEKGKYESDGCGSGGSIYIKCKSLQMKQTARIEAIGGSNGLKGCGGNGGEGRIRIKCDSQNVPWSKCHILPRPYLG